MMTSKLTLPSCFLSSGFLKVTLLSLFCLIIIWNYLFYFQQNELADQPDDFESTAFSGSPVESMSKLSKDLLANLYVQLAQNHDFELDNGVHKPIKANLTYRSVLIIPYRDREEHLVAFLQYMHAFMREQGIQYAIWVVEQVNTEMFNRGLLMNAGFLQALRNHKADCYIFHDVDLYPINKQIVYKCNPDYPMHFSSAVSTFNFKLPYPKIFGGVVALTQAQMTNTGGYPNRYFGWGGEDDDLSARVRQFYGGDIHHLPEEIGRYKMNNHTDDVLNSKKNDRFEQLKNWQKMIIRDNIFTLDYLVEKILMPFDGLFVWLAIDFNRQKIVDKIIN